jgi:type IV pilus assembly protein PilN
MIEINLLPHREARRAADLRQTAGVLILGLVVVCALIALVDRGVEQDIADVAATVRQLEADIARYKPEEEQVQKFKAKKNELEDKLDVIRGLDRARSGPVRILDELSKSTPDRLWLTGLETQGIQITVEGDSLDTGVVADFLRSLNASPYFTDVDLDRTSSGAQVEGVKLVHFIITAALADPDAESAEKEQEKAPGEDA